MVKIAKISTNQRTNEKREETRKSDFRRLTHLTRASCVVASSGGYRYVDVSRTIDLRAAASPLTLRKGEGEVSPKILNIGGEE
jgi:hypothetical protein